MIFDGIDDRLVDDAALESRLVDVANVVHDDLAAGPRPVR